MQFGLLWCGACTSVEDETIDVKSSSCDGTEAPIFQTTASMLSQSPVVPPLKVGEQDNVSERSTRSPSGAGESSEPPLGLESTYVSEQVDSCASAEEATIATPEVPSQDAFCERPSLASALGMSAATSEATAIIEECASLPVPSVPQGLKPLASQKMLGVCIASIQTSLDAEEGPVQRFMREVLGCSQFSTTPWAASRHNIVDKDEQKKGTKMKIFFRRCQYRALLPSDIPTSVARLVGIPDSVDGRSLFALGCADNQLVLVQQTIVEGIMFSDRFRLQNTFCFTQEGDDVLVEQWAQVIWTKPLPWTHTPVKMFVEKKAKAEAKATFRDFARTIQEDVRKYT